MSAIRRPLKLLQASIASAFIAALCLTFPIAAQYEPGTYGSEDYSAPSVTYGTTTTTKAPGKTTTTPNATSPSTTPTTGTGKGNDTGSSQGGVVTDEEYSDLTPSPPNTLATITDTHVGIPLWVVMTISSIMTVAIGLIIRRIYIARARRE